MYIMLVCMWQCLYPQDCILIWIYRTQINYITLHTAMIYVIQVCWQLASSIRKENQQTHMTYTTAVCTVKNSWWWTEELSETCRVLFQNKFEKLVHLGGFIIRIYHDVRSHERQTDRLLTIKHYCTIKLTVH